MFTPYYYQICSEINMLYIDMLKLLLSVTVTPSFSLKIEVCGIFLVRPNNYFEETNG